MPRQHEFIENNYWTSPRLIATDYSTRRLPEKTDVLVIGGGYTGIVTALCLRNADVAVTLIDQERIGSTASAKNGGMALTGLSVSLSTIKKTFGREKMIRLYRESLESIDCVEKLIRKGEIDCDFKRSGYLQAAYKPRHFSGLKKDQEFLSRELNHETILVPADRMNDEIGSNLYHGGLIEPISAGLHPAKYIAGLINMADNAGVDIHEGIKARKIVRQGSRFSVSTNAGIILADNVVVATNGYTTNLTPWQMKRLIPVESFMVSTQELPEKELQSLIPNNRMVFDTKRFLYYFRMSPDGKRLLFGGRPRQFRQSFSDKAVQIRKDMLKVFPQLADYSVDYAWSGILGFTADYMPVIGQNEGIHYAMGYCGHGVGMSTYFGFKLADMILGKELNTLFAANRSRPIPLYSGNPWFLPVAHEYYKALDRIA
jgi:glycine/D-amino acid oxidase-like deaminating enzyme